MFRTYAVGAMVAACATLVACAPSEEARIAAYVDEAQEIAERLAEAGSSFEDLMNAQDDPLAWSDEEKSELSRVSSELETLRSETQSMSVPVALTEVHPLLVQSMAEMIDAVAIIRSIANDAALATEAAVNDMIAKAEEGERLANEYVEQLEQVLTEQFPAMMEEA